MPPRLAGEPKPTVLLAEDDRLVLATLSHALRSAGYPTIEAPSGAEALRVCRESPPAVAIIDCDMPDVSGLDIARALLPVPFPMIFLATIGNDDLVQTAADLGAMAYLVKPVDPVLLGPTVQMAMLRYSELAALRGESVQLNTALKSARTTSIVVGLLMERLRLSEKDAYDRLRAYSRSNNRKITEVAMEILGATERLHSTVASIGSSVSGK